MICQACGGQLGRDCWNPQECAEITVQMAFERPRQTREADPVAWRVKDFADGWIYYDSKERAEREARVMADALIEPLYLADGALERREDKIPPQLSELKSNPQETVGLGESRRDLEHVMQLSDSPVCVVQKSDLRLILSALPVVGGAG